MADQTAADLRDDIHDLSDQIVEQLSANETMQFWCLHDVKELIGAAIHLAEIIVSTVNASGIAGQDRIREELGSEGMRLIAEGRDRLFLSPASTPRSRP